ncbi:MAG: DUF4395 domain-containing protein [Deltaproteobacteria bacterium]|nr:DUF4395 domain-containing protein [Deltaproteobacteria bacterium]
MIARAIMCPISDLTLDKNTSRLGAVLTAALLGIYVWTGHVAVIAFILADYIVRVFTRNARPPMGYAASAIAGVLKLEKKATNRGPKIFAWRVGFLFALTSFALYFFDPGASVLVAAALAGFNVLDGICNFCVGCVVYTYVNLPIANALNR